MKRVILTYLFFLFCIAGYCQKTLKFTDVMLYCGDTKLTVSENWKSSDAEELGITHVTEKRFYELFGQRRSIDIDYWTWKNERIGNGVFGTYSYLKEQNEYQNFKEELEYWEIPFKEKNNKPSLFSFDPEWCASTLSIDTSNKIIKKKNCFRGFLTSYRKAGYL